MNDSGTKLFVDVCFGVSLVYGLLLGLFAEFPLEGFLACSYRGKKLVV